MNVGNPASATDEFYTDTVNVPSVEESSLDYIAPGSPGTSYLFCKVAPTDSACTADGTVIDGLQMPYGCSGSECLSSTDVETLKTWILQGAQPP